MSSGLRAVVAAAVQICCHFSYFSFWIPESIRDLFHLNLFASTAGSTWQQHISPETWFLVSPSLPHSKSSCVVGLTCRVPAPAAVCVETSLPGEEMGSGYLWGPALPASFTQSLLCAVSISSSSVWWLPSALLYQCPSGLLHFKVKCNEGIVASH